MFIHRSATLLVATVLLAWCAAPGVSAQAPTPAKKKMPNYSESWEWDDASGEKPDRAKDHTACRAVGDTFTGLQKLTKYKACMTEKGWKYTGPTPKKASPEDIEKARKLIEEANEEAKKTAALEQKKKDEAMKQQATEAKERAKAEGAEKAPEPAAAD